MIKYLVGTTGALALGGMLSTIPTSSTAMHTTVQLDKFVRISMVGKTTSSNYSASSIKGKAFNWHQFSNELFSGSRGFTEEEAIKHANAIKSISTVKGKRFNL
jgi:hypothetical protein